MRTRNKQLTRKNGSMGLKERERDETNESKEGRKKAASERHLKFCDESELIQSKSFDRSTYYTDYYVLHINNMFLNLTPNGFFCDKQSHFKFDLPTIDTEMSIFPNLCNSRT